MIIGGQWTGNSASNGRVRKLQHLCNNTTNTPPNVWVSKRPTLRIAHGARWASSASPIMEEVPSFTMPAHTAFDFGWWRLCDNKKRGLGLMTVGLSKYLMSSRWSQSWRIPMNDHDMEIDTSSQSPEAYVDPYSSLFISVRFGEIDWYKHMYCRSPATKKMNRHAKEQNVHGCLKLCNRSSWYNYTLMNLYMPLYYRYTQTCSRCEGQVSVIITVHHSPYPRDSCRGGILMDAARWSLLLSMETDSIPFCSNIVTPQVPPFVPIVAGNFDIAYFCWETTMGLATATPNPCSFLPCSFPQSPVPASHARTGCSRWLVKCSRTC